MSFRGKKVSSKEDALKQRVQEQMARQAERLLEDRHDAADAPSAPSSKKPAVNSKVRMLQQQLQEGGETRSSKSAGTGGKLAEANSAKETAKTNGAETKPKKLSKEVRWCVRVRVCAHIVCDGLCLASSLMLIAICCVGCVCGGLPGQARTSAAGSHGVHSATGEHDPACCLHV